MFTRTSLTAFTFAVATVVGTAFFSGEAAATVIQVRDGNGGNVFNGGPGSQTVTINVNGSNQTISAGAFALQYQIAGDPTWVDFITYCLEPDESLGVSGLTPKNGTLLSDIGAAAEYGSSAQAISDLYNTWFVDSLGSSTKAAAFQIALWEIAFDSGANLGAGSFRLNTASAAVTNQANTYLNSALWTPGADVGVILRVGSQDLVLRVPEPATAILLGASLLLLGAARRQVRRADANRLVS